MRTFEQLINDFLNLKIQPIKWLGDSPSRFETYKQYSAKVESVTEFGVYTGLSTAAFLSGKPKKLRSYDITDQYLTVIDELNTFAIENNIDFKFQIGNSLDIEIDYCDLLFIDTVHKKAHVLAELSRHAKKVKKYILFHDTTAWPGVLEGVIEFLKNNQDWHIIEHCNKNSGLLVIEKYCD